MIGVYWPEVQTEFGQRVGQLGLVSLVYGVARMSTAVAGRSVLRRIAMGQAFVAALGTLALAVLALSGAPNWGLFLVAVAAVGVVSGLLDSIGAVFVTTIGDVGSAGLIHGMYGFGATVGPVIVVLAPTWRWSALAAALLIGGAVTVAVGARDSWPTPVTTSTTDGPAADTVRPLVTFASLGAFGSLVALEVTTGTWALTYLTESRGVADNLAAIGVSGFWAGLMIGRLLLSRHAINQLVERAGTVRLSLASLAALTGVGLLPSIAAVMSLMLVGLCLGPLVPTLFARTRERVGEAHAARMAGRQLVATNVGAIAVPALTGALVNAADERIILVVAMFVLGGVGLPLLAILRRVAPV